MTEQVHTSFRRPLQRLQKPLRCLFPLFKDGTKNIIKQKAPLFKAFQAVCLILMDFQGLPRPEKNTRSFPNSRPVSTLKDCVAWIVCVFRRRQQGWVTWVITVVLASAGSVAGGRFGATGNWRVYHFRSAATSQLLKTWTHTHTNTAQSSPGTTYKMENSHKGMTTSQTQSIFQHGRRLNLGMYSIHLVMPRSWILVPCHHCQSSCLPNVLTHTHKIPHTHKYMHTHSHAHAHRGTHTHTHVHTCKQAHTPTCTHTHTHIHTHAHTYIHTHTTIPTYWLAGRVCSYHGDIVVHTCAGHNWGGGHTPLHRCEPHAVTEKQSLGQPHTISQMWN